MPTHVYTETARLSKEFINTTKEINVMNNVIKLVGMVNNITPTTNPNSFFVEVDNPDFGMVRCFCINPDLKDRLQVGTIGLFTGTIGTKRKPKKNSKKFIYQNSFILTDFSVWHSLPKTCCNSFTVEGKLLHVMKRTGSLNDFIVIQMQMHNGNRTYKLALITFEPERFAELANHKGEIIRVRGYERTITVNGKKDNVHIVKSYQTVNQKDEKGGVPFDY